MIWAKPQEGDNTEVLRGHKRAATEVTINLKNGALKIETHKKEKKNSSIQIKTAHSQAALQFELKFNIFSAEKIQFNISHFSKVTKPV